MTEQPESIECHDCGVKEGHYHLDGCDDEICPRCGEQYFCCDCSEQDKNHLSRIPFLQIPVLCRLCGEVYPEEFMVPDEEWTKYVPPNLMKEVLCLSCYKQVKTTFPKGWRQTT